jgi:hypothetical protein
MNNETSNIISASIARYFPNGYLPKDKFLSKQFALYVLKLFEAIW